FTCCSFRPEKLEGPRPPRRPQGVGFLYELLLRITKNAKGAALRSKWIEEMVLCACVFRIEGIVNRFEAVLCENFVLLNGREV
ncbi:hypothetical protein Bhyg_13306, partial [Pseudolycoriella hygida]